MSSRSGSSNSLPSRLAERLRRALLNRVEWSRQQTLHPRERTFAWNPAPRYDIEFIGSRRLRNPPERPSNKSRHPKISVPVYHQFKKVFGQASQKQLTPEIQSHESG